MSYVDEVIELVVKKNQDEHLAEPDVHLPAPNFFEIDGPLFGDGRSGCHHWFNSFQIRLK